ncbi:MAG: peptidoglycan DD-metalloendopeptidase family protein [Chloroflexi bacterium]|nr:peptidoglycan DD-metalloendopeptidase family protein [Chloroflexota bacterium]
MERDERGANDGDEQVEAPPSRYREVRATPYRMPYLLDDGPGERDGAGRARWPWLLIGGGTVLAILAVVGVVASSGGGSGGGTPAAAANDSNPTPTASSGGQPAANRTAAPRATATATPSTPESLALAGDTPEGAIEGPIPELNAASRISILPPATVALRIADVFGTPRGDGFVHAGIDLRAVSGARFAVVSPCEGPVAAIARSAALGDYLVIDCGIGWRAVLAHMSAISVRAGDRTEAGQTALGEVTDFLHLELRFNGVPVDPAPALLQPTPNEPTPGPASPTPAPSKTPTPKPDSTATPEPAGSTPVPGATSTPIPAATATPAPPTPVPTATATPTRTPRIPTPTPRPTVKP